MSTHDLEPTGHLRFVERQVVLPDHGFEGTPAIQTRRILQQEWVSSTGRETWRDVPLEKLK